jgi:hypothetical protein
MNCLNRYFNMQQITGKIYAVPDPLKGVLVACFIRPLGIENTQIWFGV